MSVTKSNSKATALARVQALIAGTQKRFPNESITIGKTVYTTESLVQLFQSLSAAITALNTAQASAKDAGTALAAVEAKAGPVIRDFRRFVLVVFGNAAQELADFGMTPPKARAPRTAEQLAAAKAKARATREARGTASKKSKLAISGNVTGVVVTPVKAPTQPSEPVKPASPAAPPPPSPPQPASHT